MNIDDIPDILDAAAKANDTAASLANGILTVSEMNLDIPLSTINIDYEMADRVLQLHLYDVVPQITIPPIDDDALTVLDVDIKDQIEKSSNKWADYRWIPILPNDNGGDIVKALSPPKTQEEADSLMLSKIENTTMPVIHDHIIVLLNKAGVNINNYNEAIKCFDSKLYTACSYLLYALIDAAFISYQPYENKKTGVSAVKKIDDSDKYNSLVTARATKALIERLYERTDNFKPGDDNNRNMLAHGMNQSNPSKIACLQLFVLLYNVLILFDCNIFVWKQNGANNP